jgi:hypothetical protein
MKVISIKSLNPHMDDTAASIIEVVGEILKFDFGPSKEVVKQIRLYFVWNSSVDHVRAKTTGDKRTLHHIVRAAFDPQAPWEDVLSKISGFRSPYLGWNGDHFFFHNVTTHKGQEIMGWVERYGHNRFPTKNLQVAERS